MAPPSSRSRPGGGGGVLPPLTLDAVYEVLLRLAARELCRLHAVRRPWRALLSDPQFVSAHAARHPGPLVVACYGPSSGYPEGDILCEIMDLSGKVLHVSVNNFVKPSSSEQLFEAFTLDGSSDARWRANRGPPHPIDVRLNSTAVVNGIVYFFVNEDYWYDCVKVKFIASFDLETEDWRKLIKGS